MSPGLPPLLALGELKIEPVALPVEAHLPGLRPFVLMETYELLDALDRGDVEALCEELGDFLYEAVFLAQISEEAGAFTIGDAIDAICEKLVRRHPHVFGLQDGVTTAADVEATWHSRKAAEKGRESAVQGVPMALPALSLAAKLMHRAASQL